MRKPRKWSKDFPDNDATCPLFGLVDGKMKFACKPLEKEELLDNADGDVFGVWPGKWETHVFKYPTLEAKGLCHDEEI